VVIYRCPRCLKQYRDEDVDERTKPASVKCSGCKLRQPVEHVAKHCYSVLENWEEVQAEDQRVREARIDEQADAALAEVKRQAREDRLCLLYGHSWDWEADRCVHCGVTHERLRA
jgi:DNA-directed RNA polymerase subunit RPC12/RpoP